MDIKRLIIWSGLGWLVLQVGMLVWFHLGLMVGFVGDTGMKAVWIYGKGADILVVNELSKKQIGRLTAAIGRGVGLKPIDRLWVGPAIDWETIEILRRRFRIRQVAGWDRQDLGFLIAGPVFVGDWLIADVGQEGGIGYVGSDVVEWRWDGVCAGLRINGSGCWKNKAGREVWLKIRPTGRWYGYRKE